MQDAGHLSACKFDEVQFLFNVPLIVGQVFGELLVPLDILGMVLVGTALILARSSTPRARVAGGA